MWNHFQKSILIILLLGLATFGIPAQAQEDLNEGELEKRIEERSSRIEALEQEINQYEQDLNSKRQQSASLQDTISDLNASISSLRAQTQETQAQITDVQKRIGQLQTQAEEARKQLEKQKESLKEAVRAVQKTDSQTLVETLLSADSLASAWQRGDQLEQIQVHLRDRLEKTQSLKENIESKQAAAKKDKNRLVSLRERYTSRQQQVASQQSQKEELLEQTNREASRYQDLLAEKREQKEAFERELRNFEEQLQSTVSDEEVPDQGDTTFSWPVESTNITQQFGGSEFAQRNPEAYGRPFHNGTDFGVSVGTPVQAVASGVVQATGNTDRIQGCSSYGKWVLIEHNNDLSTLYGHLSDVTASQGESVSASDTIGYSGNTGYSTGPHLHLTTYVSGDVNVRRLGEVKDNTNCAQARIPVAPLEGYLDPMKYLQN